VKALPAEQFKHSKLRPCPSLSPRGRYARMRLRRIKINRERVRGWPVMAAVVEAYRSCDDAAERRGPDETDDGQTVSKLLTDEARQ